MNALVAGSGSYIVRLSVRDLHGPTDSTVHHFSFELISISVLKIHICADNFLRRFKTFQAELSTKKINGMCKIKAPPRGYV